MQELKKILEEIDGMIERYKENPRLEIVDICYGLNQAKRIIRKHMNDGWIQVKDHMPEDVYTPSELHENEFLITTPWGTEKVVKRMKCVPSGYIWFDGYDGQSAVAWRYVEPYRPERISKK